jgi:chemotaxis family two-component system response regulator Rcp1
MNQPEQMLPKPIDILLVEDDPSDVLLTRRGLEASKLYNSLSVAKDGVEALQFLRKEDPFGDAIRPDLILLDLNMPRMDGRELLQELKADESLKLIPVVVLTTSDAEKDIVESYELQASCYVTKPVKLDEFSNVISQVQDFWLTIVKYPTK